MVNLHTRILLITTKIPKKAGTAQKYQDLIDTRCMPLYHKDKSNDLLFKYIELMNEYNALQDVDEQVTDGTRVSSIEMYVSTEPAFLTVRDTIDNIYDIKKRTIQEKINCYLCKATQLDADYRARQKLPSARIGGTLVHSTEIEAILEEPPAYNINYHSDDVNEDLRYFDINERTTRM